MNANKISVELMSTSRPDVKLIIPYAAAEALFAIVGGTGGTHNGMIAGSIREYSDALYAALDSIGITEGPFANQFTGGIK